MNSEQTFSVRVGKNASEGEMEDLNFSIEALIEGNPGTFVSVQLQKGLPKKWVRYVEWCCETNSNTYSILIV